MIKKIKKLIKAYVRFVQKILLFFFLSLLYFLGFGITKLFLYIFKIKLFKNKSLLKKSFWEKDETDLKKESFFLQI